ncbi:MAG: tRNA 5-methylaminomethyl-2-thiouridine biosynthesis protein [Massilia sp.]|nr:tRNA 5-methylaminomethyl-2-thiouridine biosynthesis protein [Massilia sp.]MDB5951008.1 tRNA 5-methylaminomethyl-2-thiouridine biosynthesis protein [Massilia sp.]
MDLLPHWRGRERFVVFDTDWGDGAAFAAWVDAWRADPERPAHLHVIAIARAGDGLPGFRRMLQPEPAITLDLLHTPIDAALAQLAARIDAVHLHGLEAAGSGFARALARLLARDAVLHADGLSAQQTAALAATGWAFDSARAARYASRKPFAASAPALEPRAIVIGAGLAGAAACERLCARGWDVTLVERHPQAAMEASGNLAGITMPLLSKDDNIASRLSRAAYLFALDYWQRLGGVGVGAGAAIEGERCGVLLVAKDAVHAALQHATAGARGFPPWYAEWFDSEAAAARYETLAPHGAWLFPQGGWMRPASACQAMLDACGPRLTRRFGVGSIGLERIGDEWLAVDADGGAVAQAPVVVVANGAGANQLAQTAFLPLARVRGQVTHLAAEASPGLDLPLVLCREAYLTPAFGGVRCAGATYDDDDDPALRASSQQQNLDKLRSMLSPMLGSTSAEASIGADPPLRGRVGFRSVAPDRLPLVGALPDPAFAVGAERLRELPREKGLYGLLGYASRGLTWAPLAAELLAASLDGEPLPLETSLAAALDPGRFQLRGRRGQQ